jgi:HEPN domain-containing protein
MRDDTRNRIASAEYDMETAQTLFDGGRYPYVVFMCHLALEKMLKARVTQVTQSEPSKTHSLPSLLRKAGLDVPHGIRDFLGEITNGSALARYPDNIQEVLTIHTRDVAEEVMQSTREATKWLKNHPNFQE